MDQALLFIEAVPGSVPLAALITWGIWAVLKGTLTPRSLVESRMADKDAEIARLRKDRDERYEDLIVERDNWRVAYDATNLALVETRIQNGELLEIGRTSKRVLESLPKPDTDQATIIMPTEKGEDDDEESPAD